MGYTHYWYLNRQAEHGVKFSRALDEMEKIIADQRGILAGWDDCGAPGICDGRGMGLSCGCGF